jgi:hypothetical protein
MKKKYSAAKTIGPISSRRTFAKRCRTDVMEYDSATGAGNDQSS